jgi:hypothetical protein
LQTGTNQCQYAFGALIIIRITFQYKEENLFDVLELNQSVIQILSRFEFSIRQPVAFVHFKL